MGVSPSNGGRFSKQGWFRSRVLHRKERQKIQGGGKGSGEGGKLVKGEGTCFKKAFTVDWGGE